MASIERSEEHDSDLGLAYKVTSPIRLDQFGDELAQSMEWRAPVPLSADGNPESASKAKPAILYIGRSGLSVDRVLEIGRAHVRNEDHVVKVEYATTFEEVVAKAKAKAALTEEEIQVALRGLIGLSGK